MWRAIVAVKLQWQWLFQRNRNSEYSYSTLTSVYVFSCFDEGKYTTHPICMFPLVHTDLNADAKGILFSGKFFFFYVVSVCLFHCNGSHKDLREEQISLLFNCLNLSCVSRVCDKPHPSSSTISFKPMANQSLHLKCPVFRLADALYRWAEGNSAGPGRESLSQNGILFSFHSVTETSAGYRLPHSSAKQGIGK